MNDLVFVYHKMGETKRGEVISPVVWTETNWAENLESVEHTIIESFNFWTAGWFRWSSWSFEEREDRIDWERVFVRFLYWEPDSLGIMHDHGPLLHESGRLGATSSIHEPPNTKGVLSNPGLSRTGCRSSEHSPDENLVSSKPAQICLLDATHHSCSSNSTRRRLMTAVDVTRMASPRRVWDDD